MVATSVSSVCLILSQNGRSDLKTFFMDRCPKDEPTAKNLVCPKSSSHSREKLENPVGVGVAFTPPPGHRRVLELKFLEIAKDQQSIFSI